MIPLHQLRGSEVCSAAENTICIADLKFFSESGMDELFFCHGSAATLGCYRHLHRQLLVTVINPSSHASVNRYAAERQMQPCVTICILAHSGKMKASAARAQLLVCRENWVVGTELFAPVSQTTAGGSPLRFIMLPKHCAAHCAFAGGRPPQHQNPDGGLSPGF